MSDSLFDDVTLLLPLNGEDARAYAQDRSKLHNTINFNGNAQIDTAQKQFGSGSLLLDGVSDYVTTGAAGDYNYLHSAANDCTIELWFRSNGSPTSKVLFDTGGSQNTTRGTFLWVNGSNNLELLVSNGSGSYALSMAGVTTILANTWYHVQVVIDSGTFRLRLNGSEEGSGTATSPSTTDSTYALRFGARAFDSGLPWNGWLDDIRITNNHARPLGVPSVASPLGGPSQELQTVDEYWSKVSALLDMEGADAATSVDDRSVLAHHPTFVGGAALDTAQAARGSSSVYFDGTGDYLTIPNDTSVIDHSEDWTIEFYIRFNGTLPIANGQGAMMACRDDTASNGFILTMSDTGQARVYAYNGSGGPTIDTGYRDGNVFIGPDEWHHIAFVHDRSALSITIYVNGELHDSGTYTGTIAQGDSVIRIGSQNRAAGPFEWDGWIDQVRITKGVVRYTTEFVPSLLDTPTSYGDPYYNNVTLLLPMSGFNTSTSYSEYSYSGRQDLTNNGVTLDSTNFKFGVSSASFDGVGDYITDSDSPDFELGAEDFTYEGWVRFSSLPTSGNSYAYVNKWSASSERSYLIGIVNDGGTLRFRFSYTTDGSTSIDQNQNFGAQPTTGVWYHWAVTRVGTTIYIFWDGILLGSFSIGASIIAPVTQPFQIGASDSGAADQLAGNLDDLRFTKGTGRYTTTFTPPSSAYPRFEDEFFAGVKLLLNWNTEVVKDTSSRSHTVTVDGAAAQDTAEYKWVPSAMECLGNGSGDGLRVNNVNEQILNLSSGEDWTIECWFNQNNVTDNNSLISTRLSSGSGGVLFYITDTTGKAHGFVQNASGTVAGPVEASGTDTSLNTWQHMAACRRGDQFEIWLDGELSNSATFTAASTIGDDEIWIGADQPAPASVMDGHIQDVRITKGLARYNSSFTPPVERFWAPTIKELNPPNLIYRFNGQDGDTTTVDESGNGQTPTFVGNTVIKADQYHNGGTSVFFDGTGDYLTLPTDSNNTPDSGDFTIECWVRVTDNSSNNTIYATGNTQVFTGFLFTMNSSNGLQVFGNNLDIVGSAGTYTVDRWHHVALTRQGSTWRTFLDGENVGSGSNSGSYTANNSIYIGTRNYNSSTGDFMQGYIDDFRFTKGVAKYTADFNPNPYPIVQEFASTPRELAATKQTYTVSVKGVDLTFATNVEIDVQKGFVVVGGKTIDLEYTPSPGIDVIKAVISADPQTVFLQGPVGLEPLAIIRDEISINSAVNLLKASVLQVTKASYNVITKTLGTNDLDIQKSTFNVQGKIVQLSDKLFVTKDNVIINSKVITIAANTLPVFSSVIPDLIGLEGGSVVFLSADNYVIDSETLTSVRWKRVSDDAVIATASGNVDQFNYQFSALDLADGTDYYMEATNLVGTASSNTFTLTVNPSLIIDTQPLSVITGSGNNAVFTVAATGTGVLTYQWYKNGVLIVGETSATLTVPGVGTNDNNSQYYVIVTDDNGSKASNLVRLTVVEPPVIYLQPLNTTVEETFDYTFTVGATGLGVLSYQWYQAATPVGTDSPNFTSTSSLSQNGDSVYVEVSDLYGTSTSTIATLTVTNITRAITVQPQDQTVVDTPSGTATFTVGAKGSGTLSYQWIQILPDNSEVNVGTNSSSLTVAAERINNGERYKVVVTDSAGSSESAVATLYVVAGLPFSFVTTGFNNREIVVDINPTQTTQPRVLTAKFGDGYEQRVPDGLEPLEDTFSLSVSTQDRGVIQDITSFLDSTAGITGFKFFIPNSLVPGGVEEIPVKCTQWNEAVTTDKYYTVDIQLQRIREIL